MVVIFRTDEDQIYTNWRPKNSLADYVTSILWMFPVVKDVTPLPSGKGTSPTQLAPWCRPPRMTETPSVSSSFLLTKEGTMALTDRIRLIDDRTLTIGEIMEIRFTFDISVDAKRENAVGVERYQANGHIRDHWWYRSGEGQWCATFIPDRETEVTGNRIRYKITTAFTDSNGRRYEAKEVLSDTFDIDTKRPTLVGPPTIDNPNLTSANQVTTITFAFHERINQTTFTTDDLTIAPGGGTLENLRTTDSGTTWRVDLRAPVNLAPNTDVKGLQIGVNMSGLSDIAGNAGMFGDATPLVTDNSDNKPPDSTIVGTPNPVTKNNRQVTVTITFDEAVTGFTADNIDFSNAHVTPYGSNRIGALNSSADDSTHTITSTAAAGIEDATNPISLRNLHTIRDATGHAATGNHTSGNYEIDTQEAYLTSAMFDKQRLTAGETATVTLTFSESVSNVTQGTFQIPNGSVSDPTPVAGSNSRIWTATFTPTVNLSRTSSSIRINLDGIGDRVGNTSTGAVSFNNSIVIDTKVFVVNDATVHGSQLVLRYSDETALDPE